MRHRNIVARANVLFVLFFLFFLVGISSADTSLPGRVVLLPFDVHANRDMSYLVSGLRDMFASRLSSGAGLDVVPRTAVNEALGGKPAPTEAGALRQLALSLKADYLLTGSLTAMGGSLSLDSTLLAVKDNTAPRTFYATAPREEEIITAIDSLSWQIAEQAFGKQRPNATTASSTVAPIPGSGAKASGAEANQSAHPDKLLMGSQASGSALLRPQGVVTGALGFTKSQTFDYGLVAMEIGDVDADGQDEFVLASPYDIRIYRRVDNRYQKIGQITLPHRSAIHAVTMADLNNNGRQEIYVSAADAKDPNSLVLEWDGKEFVHLADSLSWYLRVIDIPGQGKVLAGQKSGINKLMAKGVYKVTLSQGEIVKGEEILCGGMNLFDFSLADLDGSGGLEVVAISQGDKLMVLTPSGKQLSVSDDYFGGTTRFIGGQSAEDLNKDLEHGHNEADRLYIPARIVIRDVNNDGHPDVVINKNLSSASRILSRVRSYPSGEIHALTWNGISLTELWQTRKIDGYIADYQLGALQTVPGADGKSQTINAELNVGVVLNSSGFDILSNANSAVLTFPLHLTGDEGK